MKLREVDVNALLSGGLILRGKPSWVQRGPSVRTRLDVVNSLGEAVQIEMHISTELPWKYSIVLLWNNQPIKRVDVRGSHRNSCDGSGQRWRWETHKHAFSDAYLLARAYTPDDLPATPNFKATAEEYREVFEAFCKECNITLDLEWADPALTRLPPTLHPEDRE